MRSSRLWVMTTARRSRMFCCLIGSGLTACGLESGSSFYSMDEAPTIPITEERRIGSLADPDAGFTRIHSRVQVTDGDTIYVAELSVPEIRVYTSDGRIVRRIGRRGQGPGELQTINHWGIQGDTVWVMQDDPPRITLFDRTGRVLNAVSNAGFRIRAGQVYGDVRPVSLRQDGRFDGGLVSWGMPYPYGGPRETLKVPHVIFDASGEVADTLGYGEKSLGGLPQVFEMAGGVRVDRREVFPSWALWARVGWDSIQVHRPVAETMDEGVVTVLRLNAQRDTIFRRDLRYAPRGVEERVRDSVIDARLASYSEQVQHAPALRQAVVAMTEVPMFYPPVQSVVVTDDGFVWLCRGSQDSDGWDWFLLGASGDLRGKIVLPVGALIVGRHDDALYTSETDEFGVPWLVRYHMGSGA